MKDTKIKAFTLAEVLITMAIIGVVSALTIPTVIAKYQERQTVAAVRKFYSEISQVFNSAVVKNGSPENWGWANSGAGSDHIMDIFAPYLRIKKRCGTGGKKNDCFGDAVYTTLNPKIKWTKPSPSSVSNNSTAQLDNGFLIWIYSEFPSCNGVEGTSKALQNICGSIGVDINGYKPPNALGKDTFYFDITKQGILPKGLKEGVKNNLQERCNPTSTNQRNGYACSSWIVAKGNMDYLRKTVSW